VRKAVIEDVHQLELRVGALRGDLVDPRSDLDAHAAGAGAAEDDADLGHEGVLRSFLCVRKKGSQERNVGAAGCRANVTTAHKSIR
jgi:hypothetical protein